MSDSDDDTVVPVHPTARRPGYDPPIDQKQITDLERSSKYGKAAPNTPFVPAERTRHMADMWDALINTLSVRSAYIGIRRKVFPHTTQSDASFSPVIGWCWAQMGILKYGRWPEQWLERIGFHSKYAEIFITELECLTILFCARFMFPRCRHMQSKAAVTVTMALSTVRGTG
eukprot:COSAG05_NODE_221_length_13654_cov_29.450103_11_plen_172_part_00